MFVGALKKGASNIEGLKAICIIELGGKSPPDPLRRLRREEKGNKKGKEERGKMIFMIKVMRKKREGKDSQFWFSAVSITFHFGFDR